MTKMNIRGLKMVDDDSRWPVPVESEPLRITAATGREGPAAWGQEYMWEILNWFGDGAAPLNLHVSCEVPPGVTRMQALRAVEAVVCRHETLRTGFPGWGPGALAQAVMDHLEIPVFLLSAPDSSPASDPHVRDAIAAIARTWVFDVARPPLLKVLIVERAGRPWYLALVVSHIVLDAYSCTRLGRELTELLRGEDDHTVMGKDSVSPLAQPVDQAAYEASAVGRRRNSASMAYWDRTLRAFPLVLPGDGSLPPEAPRYRHGLLRSAGAMSAAHRVSQDIGVTLPTVLLGAFAGALGAGSGLTNYPLLVRASNRQVLLDPTMLGHFAQGVPLLVDLTHEDVVPYFKALKGGLLRSLSFGYFSQASLGVLLERLARERGCSVPMRVTVNHVPSPDGLPPPSLDAMDSRSTFAWVGGADRENIAVYGTVWEPIASIALYADTAFLPSLEIEATLRRIEKLLLVAAGGERRMSHVLGGAKGLDCIDG
jgi:hypothetical protein